MFAQLRVPYILAPSPFHSYLKSHLGVAHITSRIILFKDPTSVSCMDSLTFRLRKFQRVTSSILLKHFPKVSGRFLISANANALRSE